MTKKKCIWVTGSSSGIGLSLVKNLSLNSNNIVFATSRRVNVVRDNLKGQYKNVIILKCDVTSPTSVKKCYSDIIKRAGKVDVLVNNAGVTVYKSFGDTTEKDFDDIVTTNLKGVFLCSKVILKGMLKKKSGMIINLLSVAATTTLTGSSIYAATKAGVLAMANVLRAEIRDKNIRVCNLIPGATDTPMWAEKIRNKYRKKMMKTDSISDIVNYIINSPQDAAIEDMTIRPIKGDL